ncbi:hypothetical protein CDL15_Pgr014497 [Punica granatum]|uniref:E3 ubiquitin-protein ligase APD1-4 middle domain-containing protein n=1 Tax=Punica granatum TaxID=22663 RepID=A0A218WD77_PUNGR|nr:hypothetical protein CDL15_Pgr014497 [Punica granatum]
MYRPALMHSSATHHYYHHRWRDSRACLLAPLTLWLFTVSLRYGYYGDSRIVLGPNSSRLFKASSVFVDRVEVVDDDKRGVVLYRFPDKPQLSLETNWTMSNYLIVGSYNRKGFTLWLNKGSRVRVRWEAQTSHFNRLEIVMVKGEKRYETVVPSFTSSTDFLTIKEPINGKEAEYTIEEDDKYYVSIVNANPRSIIMTMKVNVSSKMYDLTKAKSSCSTLNGSCRLELLFPKTHYIVLTTPNYSDSGDWYVEVSFVARVVTYIAILGFIVIFIFLVLKYLGVCDGETETHAVEDPLPPPVREVTETAPMIPQKQGRLTYGTNEEEDDEGGSSSSSEDLYDAKLCDLFLQDHGGRKQGMPDMSKAYS